MVIHTAIQTRPASAQVALSTARTPKTTANPGASGLYNGLGALLFSSVASRAIGVLKLLIFAPLLGPAGFGAFRIATTLLAILAPFFSLGLYTSLLRFLPEIKDELRRTSFIRSVLGSAFLLCAILLVVSFLYSKEVAIWAFSDPTYQNLTILLLGCTPAYILYQAATGYARGMRQFRLSATAEVAQNVLHLALAVVLFWIFGASSFVALLALGVALAAASQIALPLIRLFPKGRPSVPPVSGLVQRATRYSFWYALIPCLQYFFDFIDRWALARYSSMEIAGVYSLGPVLAGGMTFVGLSLAPVVTSNLIAAGGHRRTGESLEAIWSALGMSFLLSAFYACVLLAAVPIAWVYFGKDWQPVETVLPVFLLYFFAMNTYQILGVYASIREATWMHMVALALGGIANIVLNILLVPTYGMFGAAWATFAAMLLSISVHLVYINSRGESIPIRFFLLSLLPLFVFLPRIEAIAGGIVLMAGVWLSPIFLKHQEKLQIRNWIAGMLQRGGN